MIRLIFLHIGVDIRVLRNQGVVAVLSVSVLGGILSLFVAMMVDRNST